MTDQQQIKISDIDYSKLKQLNNPLIQKYCPPSYQAKRQNSQNNSFLPFFFDEIYIRTKEAGHASQYCNNLIQNYLSLLGVQQLQSLIGQSQDDKKYQYDKIYRIQQLYTLWCVILFQTCHHLMYQSFYSEDNFQDFQYYMSPVLNHIDIQNQQPKPISQQLENEQQEQEQGSIDKGLLIANGVLFDLQEQEYFKNSTFPQNFYYNIPNIIQQQYPVLNPYQYETKYPHLQ